ncbi:MAG: hypothetical protein DRH04_06570 [Deltaproteobacteria bacterium]|nr:MAG: hypothetical protein DRH04_06570 [Deltaproteobacteria bacterium]
MRQARKTLFFWILLPLCLFAFLLGGEKSGLCQEWSEMTIRLLPDSSFAAVEVKDGKKIRHCPHHDVNGKLDEEQLIYVLGTFDNERWIDQKKREMAWKHLNRHYEKLVTKLEKQGLRAPVNINQATLTELIALPQVGPVLAVKIVEYRKTVSSFETIEQIQNVEGIGAATFNAIRFYISK